MSKYVASISHGKDSMAMLEAIKILGLPLDRILTVDIWATDTIRGELPEMVEFKEKADKFILDRYGIEVEHVRADFPYDTFEHGFYIEYSPETWAKCEARGITNMFKYYGFPMIKGAWCKRLKMRAVDKINRDVYSGGGRTYIGIAADETERIKSHSKEPNVVMPLVEIGWTEADCYKWCEENDVLAPTYTKSFRDGCWFCPFQDVNSLRSLRHNHNDLWQLLLEWDAKSPVPFKSDGHTVHDYDKRFELEDKGQIPSDRRFRWKMVT